MNNKEKQEARIKYKGYLKNPKLNRSQRRKLQKKKDE